MPPRGIWPSAMDFPAPSHPALGWAYLLLNPSAMALPAMPLWGIWPSAMDSPAPAHLALGWAYLLFNPSAMRICDFNIPCCFLLYAVHAYIYKPPLSRGLPF